ncbi:hypothetical protein B0A48_06273 [Cryoendolithus antarcticus]|uniref:Uncharacterized protein n=1 Tax=Cryoendolithus antarcticus TaxID=1507870 RepID=A0A1V8TAG9_9PEZI|nr:hypothetical protein B0A48_06273 [Cryoendolithus antarcticus]
MAAPSTTTLHSDHINYLVFRYLQESGHEQSARMFAKDWYRPREFQDAEDLPFAPAVERGELVSVIQSGLRYDELQARIGRNERQHRWNLTGDARLPRESVEGDEQWQQAPPQREREESRPLSSGKRKVGPRASTGGTARVQDDFPTPAPKRQRTGHGDDDVHVNGDRDAMDVDAASSSGNEDADGEVISPAAASDDVAVTIPERYDSMDALVQTDFATGPKTSTLSFTVANPSAQIMHCKFKPSTRPGGTDLLRVGGQNISDLYAIPEALDGPAPDIGPIELPSLKPDSIVVASAWHPTDPIYVYVVEHIEPAAGPIPKQTLISHGLDLGVVEYLLEPHLLEPQGTTLHVSYSPNAEHILVLQSNLERSLVQIFKSVSEEVDHVVRGKPEAWALIDTAVLSAEWVSDSLIMVAGAHGMSRICKFHATGEDEHEPRSESLTQHNLTTSGHDLVSGSTDWTDGRYCRSGQCLVFLSSNDRRLAITTDYDEKKLQSRDAPVDLLVDERFDAVPTCMALADHRPRQAGGSPGRLAVGCEDGTCFVYSTSSGEPDVRPAKVGMLELSEPVRALAWGHETRVLAVAGVDIVRIWAVVDDARDTTRLVERPLLTWRPQLVEHDVVANGDVNGDESEIGGGEPALSWSADGTRLAFAVDKEVHIIYFRPSLSEAVNALPVNGALRDRPAEPLVT